MQSGCLGDDEHLLFRKWCDADEICPRADQVPPDHCLLELICGQDSKTPEKIAQLEPFLAQHVLR